LYEYYFVAFFLYSSSLSDIGRVNRLEVKIVRGVDLPVRLVAIACLSYIARQFMEAMEGSISLESGVGTRVAMVFRRAA
jgi:hypothetical protein